MLLKVTKLVSINPAMIVTVTDDRAAVDGRDSIAIDMVGDDEVFLSGDDANKFRGWLARNTET